MQWMMPLMRCGSMHSQNSTVGAMLAAAVVLLLLPLMLLVAASAAVTIDATVNLASSEEEVSSSSSASSVPGSDITVLIISQKDSFNVRTAYRLRQEIRSQIAATIPPHQNRGSRTATDNDVDDADDDGHRHHHPYNQHHDHDHGGGPRVLLSHEQRCRGGGGEADGDTATDRPDPAAGTWAITPLLAGCVERLLGPHTRWLVVCEALSRVNVSGLVAALQAERAHHELFLGHALYDAEPTIVHHFAHFEDPTWFPYPALRAGIALSRPLVLKLSQRLRRPTGVKFASEFFIDAAHELSMLIFNEGRGHKLTAVPYFCLAKKFDGDAAAMVVRDTSDLAADDLRRQQLRRQRQHLTHACAVYDGGEEADGGGGRHAPEATCSTVKSVPLRTIMFAVKTCSKYHTDRVPIIQQTWARTVRHVRFYSDREDASIPTIETGVPNTETGHCAKLMAIFGAIRDELQRDAALSRHIAWIVLADDDTLFNIAELTRYLAHFRHTHAADLYLGERYGFRLLAPDGFDYITGGGGIVFARPLLERLATTCVCPSSTAPDDMIVGMCVRQLGAEAVHSERFHQARPADYADELLRLSRPISFHKFWQSDPRVTFEQWLGGGLATDEATERNEGGCGAEQPIKTTSQHWEL